MREFAHLILPGLEMAGARRLVEIGAEHAGMSQILARYCDSVGGRLTSIDPSPSAQFYAWLKTADSVEHIAEPSLDALHQAGDIDAWLIDGDHNWFTVYNELKIIGEASRRDAKPLLVFMHDVGWPSARRDSYCAPDRIPAEFRHPHDFEGGVSLGSPELLDRRGFRGCGAFAWALHEGGPRNGVLTAVEDFIIDAAPQGSRLGWAFVPAVFGLGAVFDLDAPWAGQLSGLLAPYHENPLIARLEQNRLTNYLAVVDWQDRAAASAPRE
jgi:hypothetical protein